MLKAITLKKSWLVRSILVDSGDSKIEITYSGRGDGFEQVSVNGNVIDKQKSRIWFAPEFTIIHEGKQILVEVRVWPWLIIRSFRITLDSEVMYHEGSDPYKVTPLSEYTYKITSILTFIILFLGTISFIGRLIPSCP